MRKATALMVAAATLAAVTVAIPQKAKACSWECWAIGGAVVVGGALIASSAYSQGYYAGAYHPGYGYHVPPRAYGYAPAPATYGYYQPPYYDYTPAYRPVRYVKKVRYVRQEYVEPVYYEAPRRAYHYQQEPVYYQSAPQPNYVRVRN